MNSLFKSVHDLLFAGIVPGSLKKLVGSNKEGIACFIMESDKNGVKIHEIVAIRAGTDAIVQLVHSMLLTVRKVLDDDKSIRDRFIMCEKCGWLCDVGNGSGKCRKGLP